MRKRLQSCSFLPTSTKMQISREAKLKKPSLWREFWQRSYGPDALSLEQTEKTKMFQVFLLGIIHSLKLHTAFVIRSFERETF